jgi:hypothetical protein
MDLFEHYESLPLEVQAVLSKYAELDNTYDNCKAMQSELEGLCYTFEWGLDAIPYDLRELN